MRRTAYLRIVVGALFVLSLCASAVVLLTPAYRAEFFDRLEVLLDAMSRHETWGPVFVGVAFIPACLLFLPGSLLTLFAGFAFGETFGGFVKAIAAVSVGSTLGAALTFLVGRYLARGWIERQVSRHPRFQAIDAAVGREGFKIVLLMRLSPLLPFNLLNYAFGLTSVSFRDHLLASWIGMLPGTVLFVYLGSTTRHLTDVLARKVEKTPAQQALFFLGLAATVWVTVSITRIARRSLDQAIGTPSDSQSLPHQ